MSRIFRFVRRLFLKYDVFVSYSQEDREWVAELASALRSRGFRVFFDRWSIQPGASWLDELRAGLEKSKAGIVVLSPSAVKSEWVSAELAALLMQAGSRSSPLIPILYRDVKLPEPLASFQSIDFRDTTDEARAQALESLSRALMPRRISLLQAALLFLVVPLLSVVVVKAFASRHSDAATLSRLREVQDAVQLIEARCQIPDGPCLALYQGERSYPESGGVGVTDRWQDGFLKWREFYEEGRMVARDEYRYENGEVFEKVRWYFDEGQGVFLVDHFSQDGLLIRKRDCPDGPENPCQVRVVPMRSPLPPTCLLMYR